MHKCFNSIYKGKKVLITGQTGFKGAWLSLWLKELGAEVLGYALKPATSPNLFDAIGLKNKIRNVVGDIRDTKLLFSIIKTFQPEFIFHLAAQPLVRVSYLFPRLTYETNIMGTINLFEAIRKTESVKVIINVTSDKCYENRGYLYAYRENDAMGGRDPYSSSKGCSELVTSAYRSSFFNPENYSKHKIVMSSARSGNVIGGGDWSCDRIIPDCIRSLSKKKYILLRFPNAVRPWQYILEPLSGYLYLGSVMYKNGIKYGGAWNFGPKHNFAISVEELVRLVIKYWGSGRYILSSGKTLHEAGFLQLNCRRANDILKWKSVYALNKTIEKTIDWYKEFYKVNSLKNMDSFSLKQIYEYVLEARKKKILWSME